MRRVEAVNCHVLEQRGKPSGLTVISCSRTPNVTDEGSSQSTAVISLENNKISSVEGDNAYDLVISLLC